MKYRDDYKSAGVPMLAVVRGRAVVGLQVILYAWATVACSLLLIPVAHMGLALHARSRSAPAAGSSTSRTASTTWRSATTTVSPMRVFHGSITYLTLLFLAVAIDPLLPF